MLDPLGRYARLTRSLRPHQIPARMRLRTQRAIFTHCPGACGALLRGRAVTGAWPAAFVPFDGRLARPEPTPAEIRDGRITLLGHTRPLYPTERGPAAADWEQAGAPLLWRYHLHYWDWAWALARDGSGIARPVFAELYLSWRRACQVGQGVAWSPYVVSLRAWALCGLWDNLARGGPAERAVRADLGAHRAYLRAHLETDVGGNHLLKNLKALVGLAVAAGDPDECRRRVEALARELDRQVLADGGHYERAPAYHCQVLADVDDVRRLLTDAGFGAPAQLAALAEKASAMRRWLSAVLGPDGTVPQLNDGYPVGADAVRVLLGASGPHDPRHRPDRDGGHHRDTATEPVPTAEPDGATRMRCELLADSGLAILAAGPWHVLADVGPPCPDELPAHAHADTLAFLAWHGRVPVLVDTGTSTYDPGPARDAERGTPTHSTVTVDGADSTEVWGAFRAGRRARPHLEHVTAAAGVVELTAWHDGYRHLRGQPTHHRTWRVARDGVRILDRIDGTGLHRVEIAFQFAPGTKVRVRPPGAGPADLLVTPAGGQPLIVRTAGPGTWQVRRGWRATGWETTVSAPTAVYVVEGPLPVVVHTELDGWRQPDDPPTARQARQRPGQACDHTAKEGTWQVSRPLGTSPSGSPID